MKARICIVILGIFCSINTIESKTKLYALYTPSHKILVDEFFLPSIKDNFEIVLVATKQTCPSAKFFNHGWRQTTIQKVDLIIRAIKENWGDIFIFSDVDIQFFRPIEQKILKQMGDSLNLVIQKNSPNGAFCSGFFACRANEKTLHLFEDVRSVMKKTNLSDQRSLNRCLRKRGLNQYGIKWEYLPIQFFGGGVLTGKRWFPGVKLRIPGNIVMHHANWTIGIENKIAQLKYVLNFVQQKNTSNNN